MPKALDLTGQKYGKLLVISKASNKGAKTVWHCRCECGHEVDVQTTHLRSGRTTSCGHCYKDINSTNNELYCLFCGKKLINRQTKFCNNKCQADYRKKIYIQNWKAGNENGLSGDYQLSNYIRNYMLEKSEYACELCGWNKQNPFTNNIPLEIHHIDGDYTNNQESNLQVLCPNCHSLTNNYKGANLFGRKDRKKYYDEK